MKCLIKKVCVFLLFIPLVAIANWQVVKPQSAVPNEPFFQGGARNVASFSTYGASAFPNKFAIGKPAAIYAISVCGSVKENLERIMQRYHWKVVWKAPYDYNFDGRVTGSSLPNVIQKLLKPFPLQAKMYMSNRTMLVVSRTCEDV